MSIYIVDVETDGAAAGLHNMVWFGAVKVEPELKTTFEGKCKPIFPKNEKTHEALAVSGLTYLECLRFPDPKETMQQFLDWINETNIGKPMFFSDNNGFDFSFINFYFWKYLNQNPFGWSSTNLNSLWKGMEKSVFKNIKSLRKTRHDHNPVNDALGNAEALLAMKYKYGLKIKL